MSGQPFEGPLADWIKGRVEVLRRQVTAADLLMAHGVHLRYGGDRAEQVFCPFHDNTRTMAAKYHPDEGDSTAGVYCFVCQKRWDVIGIWREFKGLRESKFTAVLRAMEKEYGIIPPEMPAAARGLVEPVLDAVPLTTMVQACDRRLRGARDVFDARSYLTLGTILDRLTGQIARKEVSEETVQKVLRQVLDKIGQRCRAS